jgi:hypothetical protein
VIGALKLIVACGFFIKLKSCNKRGMDIRIYSVIAFENLSRSFSAGPPPLFFFSLLSLATADFVRAFKFFHKDFNCVKDIRIQTGKIYNFKITKVFKKACGEQI